MSKSLLSRYALALLLLFSSMAPAAATGREYSRALAVSSTQGGTFARAVDRFLSRVRHLFGTPDDSSIVIPRP